MNTIAVEANTKSTPIIIFRMGVRGVLACLGRSGYVGAELIASNANHRALITITARKAKKAKAHMLTATETIFSPDLYFLPSKHKLYTTKVLGGSDARVSE